MLDPKPKLHENDFMGNIYFKTFLSKNSRISKLLFYKGDKDGLYANQQKYMRFVAYQQKYMRKKPEYTDSYKHKQE